MDRRARVERGERYEVAVEDSAATLVELAGGVFGTILSSWATRVRRDDLFTLQVDGTKASALAGLHRCHVQPPRRRLLSAFQHRKDLDADYRNGWTEVPALAAIAIPIASAGNNFCAMCRRCAAGLGFRGRDP